MCEIGSTACLGSARPTMILTRGLYTSNLTTPFLIVSSGSGLRLKPSASLETCHFFHAFCSLPGAFRLATARRRTLRGFYQGIVSLHNRCHLGFLTGT